MTDRRRGLLLASAAAAACSAIWATQNAFRLPDVGWLVLFLDQVPIWFFWAAAVPAIFIVTRIFPLTRDRWLTSLAAHVPAALGLSFAQMAVVQLARRGLARLLVGNGVAHNLAQLDYLQVGGPFFQHLTASWTQYFAVPLIVYSGIALYYHARTSERQLERKRLRERELEASLTNAKLDSLRAQLHPHFLFNTLNTVASLMARDVPAARSVIINLSDLLRHSLGDSSTHEIPLSSELEFLQAYVAIQKARFGERLVVDIHADAHSRSVMVPGMILQPLVENSIRHGMPAGDVPLHIAVSANARDGVLELSVVDDGVGVPPVLRDGDGSKLLRSGGE